MKVENMPTIKIDNQDYELDQLSDEAKEKYARRKVPVRRYGMPEEVAHMTLSLCLPASSFVNGAAIVVDGGMSIKHG